MALDIIYNLYHKFTNIYPHSYIQFSIFLYINNILTNIKACIYDHNLKSYHKFLCMESEIFKSMFRSYQNNHDHILNFLNISLNISINFNIFNQNIWSSFDVCILLKLLWLVHNTPFDCSHHNILIGIDDRMQVTFHTERNTKYFYFYLSRTNNIYAGTLA